MDEPNPGPRPDPPPGDAPDQPIGAGADAAPAGADSLAGSSADPPAGSPADPLAEMVAALDRAGLDPAGPELADALWLARWSRPTTAPAGPRPADTPGGDAGPTASPGFLRTLKGESTDGKGMRLVPPTEQPPDHRVISLYPGTGTPGRGRPLPGTTALGVTVPEAAALPKLLELQAALRPLQRYHSPARPRREVLDEAATAELTARSGGLMWPVFRPEPRGDAAMQLLMDASSSMFVWERMLRELATVFERLGAFHEVQVRYLHATPEGDLAVSGRFDPEPAGLRSPQQLSDPTGRRVTLLVSDCVGPLWRSGQAHRLLDRLLRIGPAAVLQPLPARLWNRTRLPVSYGVLHRAAGLSTAAPLRFSAGPGTFSSDADALPVPVLPPTAAALGAWARLLAGMGAGEVPAAVGWVRADHPATHSAPRRTSVPVPALVGRFRSAASPAAAQLAVYLAAAPLFLPVMQLVQRTMLPDSGPAELAEVLLSGLLVRGTDADHRWYHFADGVRDALLTSLGRDEALLVLKHCSQYVEQRFGKGGPNFPALAITQLTEGLGDLAADESVRSAVQQAARASGARDAVRDSRDDEPVPAVGSESPQPFAEVAARVLERFMPLPHGPGAAEAATGPLAPSSVVRQARALAARFHVEGMVQNLLDAVQLLRAATAREGVRGIDPDLWSELAQQLTVLWRVRGGADLLREAQEAAATAAAHPGSVRARAVRARVFQAAAEDRAAAGDDRAALELLRRADREFTAVCASPELEPRELLDATLERVRVLEDQWRLGGDAGLLHETLGMLEAFADAWPPVRARPSGLPLAHGRALLRLAESARDGEGAEIFAERAAVSFASGLDALEREDAAPELRHPATLSLIDAQLLRGGGLEEAQRLVDRALGEAGADPGVRAALLLRDGRIAVARYAAGGPPAELESAATRFAEACRLTSRDRPEYREMVAEWGGALLDRAELPGGGGFVHRAVQVLRDCRMETPESDPMLPERLLMLGRALILRYRAEQDLVDLREAENILGLAAKPAVEPGQVARIWYELGESHRLGFLHTHRPERLDMAADAYRRAAESAAAASEEAAEPGPMARLSALAHHWRGVVYESARRPRAAAEAYRAALAEWRRAPGGGDGSEARRTARRLDALTRKA
ncbi:SAV_2336 N-terminal domain-related protein [Streptomyces sp. NBC_01190]|uniref:SAV_2336 N-terminal domain-related protein n=1 Tax=Streptomyces sp. NBC_01190 TaxID=2903767 RepID=UPI00386D5976|nr:SAV_2336 family protein [Streptomyces sp. NBC_01190]